jgi:ribose 5-phosphate isomerase B
MRVAVGCDHAGFLLKPTVVRVLADVGCEVVDCGTWSDESVDYPDFGRAVADKVAQHQAELGVVICGTGIGISIAANKTPGIRAALCHDTFSARMCREHNNANVLAMGSRVIGSGLAEDILRVFLSTDFAGGRHCRRVDKLEPGLAATKS